MKLQSLGYRTDLFLIQGQGGEVVDRGDYLLVRTPSNPDYFWGNFLVYENPPEKEDASKWCECFRNEFSSDPRVRHMAFGWDAPDGNEGQVEAFLAQNFSLERSVVMTATSVIMPSDCSHAFEVRELVTDSDWQQATENQVRVGAQGFPLDEYRRFKNAQMKQYRNMAALGRGAWFGAFNEKALIADLGIYHDGEVGRFQSVVTHPDFRRKGACTQLVYGASKHALHSMSLARLVMVADPDYHAARIYERLGFRPTEKQVGVCRRPANHDVR